MMDFELTYPPWSEMFIIIGIFLLIIGIILFLLIYIVDKFGKK